MASRRPDMMSRVGSDAFEEPVPERILVAVADTLRISRDDILLSDSFPDLGGDEKAAQKLEERLRKQGISVAARDAMRCRTMAELQTCARSVRSSASYSASDRQSADSAASSIHRQQEIFTPTRTRETEESVYGPMPGFRNEDFNDDVVVAPPVPKLTEKSVARKQVPKTSSSSAEGQQSQPPPPPPATATPADAKPAEEEAPKPQTETDRIKLLEQLFQHHAAQDRYCVVKATAGPFQKKIVGFVSLRAESCDVSEGIKLASEDEYQDIEERIKAFWLARQRHAPELPWPEYWIPVKAMVVKSGDKPATRALQWWLRNLPEDVEQRTYTLQRLLGLHLLERDYPAPLQVKNSPNTRERSAEPPKSQERHHRNHEKEQRDAAGGSRSRDREATSKADNSHRRERKHRDDDKKERREKKESERVPEKLSSEEQPRPRERQAITTPRNASEALLSDDAYVHIPIPMIPEGEGPQMPYYDGPGSRRRSSASRRSLESRAGRPSRKPSVHRSIINNAAEQMRLSTTRPEKTFSMWIENEAGQLQKHENMGETPDDAEFFPLSAMQQLFFRTSMNLNRDPDSITEDGYRFSQSILLRITGDVKDADVESSIGALVERHSMLRSRFRLTREGWAQVVLPATKDNYGFERHHIEVVEDVGSVVDTMNSTINAVKGPIFSAALVDVDDGQRLLFLVAHHLAVDVISWRIMFDDLDELFRHGTVLTDPSIPFSNWIEYQAYESSHRLVQPKLPFEISPPSLGYWDLDLEANRYSHTECFRFDLDADLTHTLRDACNNVFRTEPDDLFLAALLLSFCKTFPDRQAPTMWTQEHGRDSRNADFNIDETVGWFTSLCPVRLTTNEHGDIMELVKLMKDTRNVIPDSGISFFNSEFLVPSAPYTTIPVEIIFSFIHKERGEPDPEALLEPAAGPGRFTDSLTADIGSQVGRIALFEFSVACVENQTRFSALYIKPQRKNRIEQWLELFHTMLIESITKISNMAPELTLADAPLLKTTYQGLSKLVNQRLGALGIDNVNNIETLQPINPSQQEILIAQSLDPESFHVHGIYELTVPPRQAVNSDDLAEAWTKVVVSHAALRSIFIDSVSEDGVYDQVVFKVVTPHVTFVEGENALETLTNLPVMEKTPAQPQHRLAVCQADNRTFIRIDASQAICDALTIDNLITKMRQAMAGKEPEDNFSLLQSHLFNATTMDTTVNLQSWQSVLTGARPCIFPSLVAQLNQYEHRQSQYTGLEVTVNELADFCVEHEVEGAYVLQLAWALVLRVFVGMNQVTFGYEVSGRSEAQLAEMKWEVGSFASLLPCTIDLSPGRSLGDCLQSLGEVAAIARQSQNPTMPEILHTLQSDTLFNTCLSMRDFANARHKFPDLDAGSFRANLVTSSRLSNTDVSVSTMFIDDHVHVDISTRHISPSQVGSIVRAFERAIRVILDDPEQNISGIDLFTEGDHARLVRNEPEFTLKGDKSNKTIHQLVLNHAQTQPKAQAVCAWDGNMTYNQFSYCVSTLATYLRNIGVAAGVVVPVVIEKSKWAPVIMVAVMKAGGSIVSMDAQDKSYVENSIKQLEPRIVVATESAWNDVVCIVPNLVIVNERFFSILPPQVSIPMLQAKPEHGAVVIYSPSKSKAGASKGLFFTHGSLAAAFLKQGTALKIDQNSRVLQLSAYNVDIALVEVLCTLVNGGCVCIPSGKERIPDIGGFIASKKVTWSYMTTALARRIDPAAVPDLQTVCFRTRRMDEDTLRMWLEDRTVLMAYGAPDVCPLGISIEEVTEGKNVTVIPPPLLGRFWILNPEDPKKLMPIGAIGELAIDCPALKPHKYVPGQRVEAPPDMIAKEQPSRLRYLKTGHRVRYLNDGAIQFLSSSRDETFIDGSPVSVTSVEQHLRRCLGGHIDVAVESVTTNDSVQTLAAFLEVGEHLHKDSEEFSRLKARTNDRIQLTRAFRNATITNMANKEVKGIPPEYVPTVFIPLKHFPVSASLKINRRKLQRMAAGTSYNGMISMSTAANQNDRATPQKQLPLTHLEERMRHIWASVLDLPLQNIKSDDTFMSLGGDKYLAIKLLVACRKSSVNVSLIDILKGATLAEVSQVASAVVENENEPNSSSGDKEFGGSVSSKSLEGFDDKFIEEFIAPQMKLRRRDIADIAEASAYQIRALETRLYGKKVGMKCLVFNFNGPVKVQKLMTACETLSKLHPIFRTGFAIHDRHVYQVLIENFKPEFQRYPCPAWCLGSVADNVISEDQDTEFRPEEPSTKFTFLDAGQQSTLIIRLSNAQIDEGATVLLVRDLAAIYEGQGNISYRPTFFDYMRAVDDANAKAGLDYWKKRLKGAKMTKFVSHSRPYAPVSDVKTLTQTLDVRSVGEYGLTFSTVLKAAWAIALAEHAARSDVVFGEVVQGHHVPLPDKFDLFSMIGPTTNIVPVRVRFTDSNETPLDFMRRIHDRSNFNRPHEGMGALQLVQRCTSWRYWSRFSTVLHHRSLPPLDSSTTLNMGDTTFTHSTVEHGTHDIPDLLITTTMVGPDTVHFEMQFSESRVPTEMAEEALRVLTIAVGFLTSEDTIESPIVQSGPEITRSPAKIPIAGPPGLHENKDYQSLPHDERQALQAVISGIWTSVLDPKPLGVPDDQLHKANFYDLWGSVLPAHFFAERINAELMATPIKGLNKLQVTPMDVIENPTMAMQYDLIVRKMAEAGVSFGNIRRRTLNWGYTQSGADKRGSFVSEANGHGVASIREGSIAESTAGASWPTGHPSLRKTAINKLRGLQSSSSIGSKAGNLLRRHRDSKVSSSNESTSSQPQGIMIGAPVATELPQRAIELRNHQRMSGFVGASPNVATSNGFPTPPQNQQPFAHHVNNSHLASIPSFISSVTSKSDSDFDPVSPTTATPIHEVTKTTKKRRDSVDSVGSNDSDSSGSPLGQAWMAM